MSTPEITEPLRAPETVVPLTARQLQGLHEALREAREVYDVDIRHVDDVHISFGEEIRAGRGHDLRFDRADADHVTTGAVDVYGRWRLAVGQVTWIHDSVNEECDCGLGGCAVEDELDDHDQDWLAVHTSRCQACTSGTSAQPVGAGA